jgi:PiT family inorganic phosphate transporter
MGVKITRLEPVNGFAAETAASIAILIASRFGIPLSTTHTIGTAIMGVGSTRRMRAVNWSVSRQIIVTWLVTFPACLILGFAFAWLFKLLFAIF